MIFFFGNHMKVNQTFPKQMKDSDQEQSEDEAEVLRAVVIQSHPRHCCASRLLPGKTSYCSSAAPGEPLSTSSCPWGSDTTQSGIPARKGCPEGYQGEDGRAEVIALA